MNEIEQDDEDEDAIIYSKSDFFDNDVDDELNTVGGVNWLQEAAEQRLQEEEKKLNESKTSFEDQLNILSSEMKNVKSNDLDKQSSPKMTKHSTMSSGSEIKH